MSSSSSRNQRTTTRSMNETILLMAVAMASFFAGTVITLHVGLSNSNCHTNPSNFQLEQMVQRRMAELQAKFPDCSKNHPEDQHHIAVDTGEKEQHSLEEENNEKIKFPKTVGNFMAGVARTPKSEFIDLIDTGVPPDLPNEGDSEVLIFYQRSQAFPKGYSTSTGNVPSFSARDALEHCDFLDTMFVDHSRQKNACIAMMPNYEGWHLQRWMRMPEKTGAMDSSLPLRPVGRGLIDKGKDFFHVPVTFHRQGLWKFLQKYFDTYEASLKVLEPLLKQAATPQKTVVIMISNFGQSELLANFACANKARGLDLQNIVVFATDQDTKDLAESLGLLAFYDEQIFSDMPEDAAGAYGDKKFTAMMLAKVICVQMVNSLKYNVLFQDVDIVWYKNPIPFFEENHKEFDMLFQDDGGHSIRYAPYSANSGFYYVRYNAMTEYFFSNFLLSGDLVQKWDSHQQALIALLVEHVSLFGLRVKVFSRDTPMFPGGYQYHQKSGNYMRSLLKREIEPYIFHMSWTHNKDNKLLFFQQLGEWYVHDPCIHQKVQDVSIENGKTFVSTCCAAKPLISCHYRDKPSIVPCKDSPPIDKGKPSWWK